MRKRVMFVLAAVAVSALVLWAQNVDGVWTREVQGKAGTQTQTLTLKSEGGKLTGTLEGGFGGRGGGGAAAAPISEGTISGSDVSFKVVRDFGGNTITQVFKGTVSGNELKLTMEVEGGGFGKGGGKGPQEMVFTKK